MVMLDDHLLVVNSGGSIVIMVGSRLFHRPMLNIHGFLGQTTFAHKMKHVSRPNTNKNNQFGNTSNQNQQIHPKISQQKDTQSPLEFSVSNSFSFIFLVVFVKDDTGLAPRNGWLNAMGHNHGPNVWPTADLRRTDSLGWRSRKMFDNAWHIREEKM